MDETRDNTAFEEWLRQQQHDGLLAITFNHNIFALLYSAWWDGWDAGYSETKIT
jgi:hypothetical protein